MASLKDLKNRIASVKSTQKITKAMQMVAAAKLRRAQEAAIAARPYAERMTKVLGSLSAAYAGRADAPTLLGGTGKDQVHLLVVATGERGLAGGFNSSIARLARDEANRLLTRRQDGQDPDRRPQGQRHPQAPVCRQDRRDDHASAKCGRSATSTRRACATRSSRCTPNGEFDVATLFFATFKSVISQVPTALQLIPAKFEPVAADAGAQ